MPVSLNELNYLPRTRGTQSCFKPLDSMEGTDGGPMARKVLVVDDEPLVLDVVATMLADLGCDVETATRPEDALQRIGKQPDIDILVADVNMPGLDGRKLAFRAKQMQPDLQVLLLSGREHEGYGFPIIRKPFLEADLRRIMSATTGLC
jgi:two-component system cell cycle response regulator CpdR